MSARERPAFGIGEGLLLLMALIWGGGFVAQKLASEHLGPMTFTSLRFALGAAVLVPLVLMGGKVEPTAARASLVGGVAVGAVTAAAALVQQWGIGTTDATRAGFITGLYVAFVPVLGLLVGQRTGARAWLGVGVAVVGLALFAELSWSGLNAGDLLVLLSAALWAAQVLVVAGYAGRASALRLAVVQMTFVAIVLLPGALVFERPSMEGVRAAGWALLYSGVLSIGVAFTLQIVGQRTTPAANAAIIMSLEMVFAGLAGWLLLGETMSGMEMVGGGVIVLAMLVAQVPLRVRRRGVSLGG